MDKNLIETLVNPLKTTSHKAKILDRARTIVNYLETWDEEKISIGDWNAISSLALGMNQDAIEGASRKAENGN